MPHVAAKPMSLYRIEGSKVAGNEKKVRQLAYTKNSENSAVLTSDEDVEDFSDEFYDDVHVPKERLLYQNEVDKLVHERREMFARNLVSMSISLSFTIIVRPPPEPEVIASGDESPYDTLRSKLLGDGSGHEQDDQDSINKANDLASDERKANGTMVNEPVNTVTDYSADTADEGYVTVREKLLGKGNDTKFQEMISEDINKANELAAQTKNVGGGPKKNLRRR
jgi:hypothetical protein